MFAGSEKEESLLVESASKANQESGLPYDTPQLQPNSQAFPVLVLG